MDNVSGESFQLAQLSFDTLIAEPGPEWKAANCNGTLADAGEEELPSPPKLRRAASISSIPKKPKAVPAIAALLHSLEDGDKEAYSLSFLARTQPSLDASAVEALLCGSRLRSGAGSPATVSPPASDPSSPAREMLPFEMDWGARMTSGAAVTQLGEHLLYQPPQEWERRHCDNAASTSSQEEDDKLVLSSSAWKKGGHPIPLAAAYIPPSGQAASDPSDAPPYQLLLTGLQLHSVTGVRPEEQLQSLLCQEGDDFWPGKTDSGRRFKQLSGEGVVMKPTAGFVTSYCTKDNLKQAEKDAAATVVQAAIDHTYWPLQTFGFKGDELPQHLPLSLADALDPSASSSDNEDADGGVDVPLPVAYMWEPSSSSWQVAFTDEWLASKLDLPRKVVSTYLRDGPEGSPRWVRGLFSTSQFTLQGQGQGLSEENSRNDTLASFNVTVLTVASPFSSNSGGGSSRSGGVFVLSDAYHRARLGVPADEDTDDVLLALAAGERPLFRPAVGKASYRRNATGSAASASR